MKKLTDILKIIAIISGLLLLADIFFHFRNKVLHWGIFRYLLIAIIMIVYTGLVMQSYKSGNMRKLREMILVAVILFMISVLVFFLS